MMTLRSSKCIEYLELQKLMVFKMFWFPESHCFHYSTSAKMTINTKGDVVRFSFGKPATDLANEGKLLTTPNGKVSETMHAGNASFGIPRFSVSRGSKSSINDWKQAMKTPCCSVLSGDAAPQITRYHFGMRNTSPFDKRTNQTMEGGKEAKKPVNSSIHANHDAARSSSGILGARSTGRRIVTAKPLKNEQREKLLMINSDLEIARFSFTKPKSWQTDEVKLAPRLRRYERKAAVRVKEVSVNLRRSQMARPSNGLSNVCSKAKDMSEKSRVGDKRKVHAKSAKKMSKKAKINELRWFRLIARKKMKSPNPEVRIRYKLEKAKRKESWLVEKLMKFYTPNVPAPVHDPEILSREEKFYLKRTGEKKKHYVIVGRRGVIGGVVLNMHLHWKRHETVKVICKPCKPGQVLEYAEEISRLSKGIVLDIKNNNTIIFYRGKNYVQPDVMCPTDTLSKPKALEKYKLEQSLEHTGLFIERLEKDLEEYLKHVASFKKRDTESSKGNAEKECTTH